MSRPGLIRADTRIPCIHAWPTNSSRHGSDAHTYAAMQARHAHGPCSARGLPDITTHGRAPGITRHAPPSMTTRACRASRASSRPARRRLALGPACNRPGAGAGAGALPMPTSGASWPSLPPPPPPWDRRASGTASAACRSIARRQCPPLPAAHVRSAGGGRGPDQTARNLKTARRALRQRPLACAPPLPIVHACTHARPPTPPLPPPPPLSLSHSPRTT